jgi:amidophosphoribosyltransferase
MLRDAGAAEVHVRISSPPVVSPCFYGIDMADEDELAAAHRSVEEMRDHVGATTLHYLSLEGMQSATRLPEASVCRACFTREYPTATPPRRTLAKHRFEPTPA